MSRNQALEKIGRAKLAYVLMKEGWQVGEAFDDGYDLLAHHSASNTVCRIELKTMDIDNRSKGVNLTAPVSPTERNHCTHIVVYVEPKGWFFIARKDRILTDAGNIFAAINENGERRKPRGESKSFAKFQNAWGQLLE